MNFKRIFILILFLAMGLFLPKVSDAQIIRPTGNASEASTQLIYYYDQDNDSNMFTQPGTTIQVTNTNDEVGVWIHVQIFRNDDPDDDDLTPNIYL